MSGTWWSVVAVVACLLLAAVVGIDRNRLQQRLGRTEGALAELRLELAAAQDRIIELHQFVSRPENWNVDVAPPAGRQPAD